MTDVFDAPGVFRLPGDVVAQDWPALAHRLAEDGHDLDPTVPPRQFAGGFGNMNYLLRLDGHWAVLRRPPLGPLPPGANDMGREYRVIAGLSPVLPLVPRPLHFCDDETVLGRPFLIMEYRPGMVIGADIPKAYRDRTDIGGVLSAQMIDFLAALHAVDPEDADLADLGRPAGFLDRAVSGWAKRARVATDDSPPASIRDLVRWLGENLVEGLPPTLLHNDFKLDNMILDPADLSPVAVVDWDMGSRGDPLFDLATLLSYWVEPGDPQAMHDIDQMPTAGHGFPGRRTVVDAYAERTGRDVSDILFYRVLAAFKLGVVFLQLHARYRRGETDDARYADFGRIGEELLDFAWDIANRRAF